jgi:hypothetical protein
MDQPAATPESPPAAQSPEQPTAPIRNQPSLELLKDAVHVSATLLLGISSFCFVIGLLIVNLRLAAYGVHSLEIDRAEYVLVGAVAALLCTASYFALGIVSRHLKSAFGNLKAREFKKCSGAFFAALGTLLTAQLLLSRLSDGAAYFTDWRVWASIIVMGAIASIAYAIAKRMYAIWMQLKAGQVPPGWLGEQVTATAEALGLLAVEIGMYAFLTYPMISMAYGGGHRGAVELLLTERGAQVAKELGLPMTSATSAGPVYILTESEHDLVVTTNNSFWPEKQYNQIRKELIEATKAMKIPEPAPPKKPPAEAAPRPATSVTSPKEHLPSSSGSSTPSNKPTGSPSGDASKQKP